jgi:hypothetical protein
MSFTALHLLRLIPLLACTALAAPLPLPAILRRIEGLDLGNTLSGITSLGNHGSNNGIPIVGNAFGPSNGPLGNLPLGSGGLLLSNTPADGLLSNIPVISPILDHLDTGLGLNLGVALDLQVAQTLTCGNVNGWWGDKQWDMGCTCYGTDGGLLLEVEVDVDAELDLGGLDLWVKAQVSLSV